MADRARPVSDHDLRVLIVGQWLMYRDNSGTLLGQLVFEESGTIRGGAPNERFWLLDGRTLVIFSEEFRPTTICEIDIDRFCLYREISGRYQFPFEGRTDVIHIFRKLGARLRTHTGPLPLVTSDIDEARRMDEDRQDFSFLLHPAEVVRSAYNSSSAYRGSMVPEHRTYVFAQEYEAGPVFFHVLSNATLINGVVVLTKHSVPLFETTYQADLRTGNFARRAFEHGEDVCLDTPFVMRYETRPTLLMNTLGGNFGHWHTQSLPNSRCLRIFPASWVKPRGISSSASRTGCVLKRFGKSRSRGSAAAPCRCSIPGLAIRARGSCFAS
ncbi:hypothetical protein [Acidisoma sp. C75]